MKMFLAGQIHLRWTSPLQFLAAAYSHGNRSGALVGRTSGTGFGDIGADQFSHLRRSLAALRLRKIYRSGDRFGAPLHPSFGNSPFANPSPETHGAENSSPKFGPRGKSTFRQRIEATRTKFDRFIFSEAVICFSSSWSFAVFFFFSNGPRFLRRLRKMRSWMQTY